MLKIHDEHIVKNVNKEGPHGAILEPKAKEKISNTDPGFLR